ncbi:MAG: dihydropyrimidinase [Acidobacteria bacterium]|nr:dihydropyrimidinase [Acidobacteriota bacterium]
MTDRYDLIVRNGTVVTAADRLRCDIGVRAGQVAALADHLQGNARETIDATGMLVLPGGIDSHCHIAQKSSTGLITADDFYSGGVSAAAGGTTTLIPFATQHRGQSLSEVVRDYHRKAEGMALVDYGFHLSISDPTPDVLARELPELIQQGYTSLKIYTTYDALKLADRQILNVLEVAKHRGAMVMVHAENSDAIAWTTERLLRAGQTAPRYHPVSRPQIAEREATHRVIALAELVDVPILIVHVSGRQALEQIAWARSRGLKIYAETCPQYLLLTAADLDKPGFEGAKLIFSPPAREQADQEALWQSLTKGLVQVFSSDHAPYRYDDPQGKQAHGLDAPFTKVANGIPGLETRLPLLFSEGVGRGRIDIHTFVAVTATNAARIYGVYPRKGTIEMGSDADLAIWDPEVEVTIHREMLHDRMDYTAFEGMKVKGWPRITISRGEVLWSSGEVRGNPGRGRFLRRATPMPCQADGAAL